MVTVEVGVEGAVADEGPQPEADAGRPWQRRRLSEAGAALSDKELSRRALEADALAVEGMERTRVLGGELLQAHALIARLEAEVRIQDVIIQSKDDQLKAETRSKDEAQQSKDALLQAKDDIIQSKDAIIQSKDDQLLLAKTHSLPRLPQRITSSRTRFSRKCSRKYSLTADRASPRMRSERSSSPKLPRRWAARTAKAHSAAAISGASVLLHPLQT